MQCTCIPLKASRWRKSYDRDYVPWADQIIIQVSEEMYHDKQVWVIIEDTHDGNTGVLVPVLILLVAVVALKSTMFHLKDIYIT